MQKAPFVLVFAILALTLCYAQDQQPASDSRPRSASTACALRTDDQTPADGRTTPSTPAVSISALNQSQRFGVGDKLRYYLGETYLNPSFLTAPAFRASIRMANPPGHFPTAYPADWRQGAEGFGRNYGDATAQRVSFHTARFATGALLHEDPRYAPSSRHSPFARSLHALGYTFIDQSDSGHRMPAFSNLVGSAAAGFVGSAYLPPGFANLIHAGQRATLQFGFFAAGNLYREFAPQMPRSVRTFFELIGR